MANVVARFRVLADRVWQDAAGTTPAGVGDPVGRWEDPDTGIAVTQDVSGRKLTLLQDANGHLYLDGDGLDDYLSNAAFQPTPAGAQPFTVVAVARAKGVASTNPLWGTGGSPQDYRQRTSSDYQLQFGTALRRGTPNTDLRIHHTEVNGAASAIYIDNELQGTVGNAGTNAWAAGLYVLSISSLAQFGNQELYELIILDGLDDAMARTALYDELSTYYSNPAGGGDPEPINLFASAQGQALADAQVLRQVLMQAGAQGSGAAMAALQALRHLEAVAVGAGDAEAQILIERYAEATGDAAGAAQAALSIARHMAAVAQGSGSAEAGLQVTGGLTATAGGSGSASAQIQITRFLSALSAGQGSAQATTLRTLWLQAAGSGLGAAEANLATDTALLLAGVASGSGSAEVQAEIARLMEAQASGSGAAGAALFLARMLVGEAAGKATATATLLRVDPGEPAYLSFESLTVQPRLTAQLSVGPRLTATLSVNGS